MLRSLKSQYKTLCYDQNDAINGINSPGRTTNHLSEFWLADSFWIVLIFFHYLIKKILAPENHCTHMWPESSELVFLGSLLHWCHPDCLYIQFHIHIYSDMNVHSTCWAVSFNRHVDRSLVRTNNQKELTNNQWASHKHFDISKRLRRPNIFLKLLLF